jgi:threonine/homoserine/homoserine lactone efflux protein
MIRSLFSAPVNLEVPAPIVVGAVLIAGALAKEGLAQWAIAGLCAFYLLYLATQYCKRRLVEPQVAGADSL